MDWEKKCREGREIVLEAAAFIRRELGRVGSQDIEEKSLNSLVSYVDRNSEELLVEKLGKILPGATFLTEEETVARQGGELQWVVDPLDGTTNFIHQLPVFSISVALRQEGQLVVGIVHEVNREECFYAWKGGGAYLNGRPIRVSPSTELANSLLATGFPYHDYERMDPYLRSLKHFMLSTRGIRRFGSAAVDLAYVACGRFDAFFEYSLNAWDVAAGALIVQEAGGIVTDFRGREDYLFGREIIAANRGIFDKVQEVISETL